MREAASQLARASRRLEQDLGREPLDHELALELQVDVGRVHEVRRAVLEPLSLEAPTGADGEGRLGDGIPDANAPVDPLGCVASTVPSRSPIVPGERGSSAPLGGHLVANALAGPRARPRAGFVEVGPKHPD